MVVIFGAKKVKQKIAELEARIAVLEEKLLVKEQIDKKILEQQKQKKKMYKDFYSYGDVEPIRIRR